MKRLELKKGATYRVLKPGAHLNWLVPCGPSAWSGESKNLPVGAEITFLGDVMGWGSDNIPVANFEYQGKKGEFWPNNWGRVEDGWLEPASATAESVR